MMHAVHTLQPWKHIQHYYYYYNHQDALKQNVTYKVADVLPWECGLNSAY